MLSIGFHDKKGVTVFSHLDPWQNVTHSHRISWGLRKEYGNDIDSLISDLRKTHAQMKPPEASLSMLQLILNNSHKQGLSLIPPERERERGSRPAPREAS